jgi:hypothetical protein
VSEPAMACHVVPGGGQHHDAARWGGQAAQQPPSCGLAGHLQHCQPQLATSSAQRAVQTETCGMACRASSAWNCQSQLQCWLAVLAGATACTAGMACCVPCWQPASGSS